MDSCRQTFGTNKYDLNRLSDFVLFGSDDEYDYAITLCDVIKVDACHGHTVPYEIELPIQSCFSDVVYHGISR